MSEQTIILKNLLNIDYVIDDIGYYLNANSTVTLSDQFSFSEICDSNDLKTLVSDGTSVTINNGSIDLSISDALNYISRENIYDTRDFHYTKDDLITSGDSTINYHNIINDPQLEPVNFLVTTIDSAIPGYAELNHIYANTNDLKYYKYDGTNQIYLTDININDRVIPSWQTNQPIYNQNGSYFELIYTPNNNDSVIIEDNGTGIKSHYVYDSTSLDSISGTSLLNDLNQEISDRIDADATIQNQIDTLNDNIKIIDGILYVKDSVRNLYLAPKQAYIFSRNGNATNSYLYIGSVLSNKNSFHLNGDYVITSISAQLSDIATDATIHIRKSGETGDIFTIVITNDLHYDNNNLNIQLNHNDSIEIYCTGSGHIQNPIVDLFLSRNSGLTI